MENAILRSRTASQLTFFGPVNLAGTIERFPEDDKNAWEAAITFRRPQGKGLPENL